MIVISNKKYLFIAIIIFLGILTSCSTKDIDKSPALNQEKITIYTTLYVLADFAEKIGGDNVEVLNMVPSGVSEHDYEPTAKEIVEVSQGDLFIYNGAGLEVWVQKVLNNLNETSVKQVNASEGIAVIYGGHEDYEDHDELAEDHDSTEEEEEEAANIDPHVWLNPLNALKQAERIKDALVAVDPSWEEIYEENYFLLEERLLALDELYRQELNEVAKKEFFVSHSAFAYLAEEYGLEEHSISGIIPGAEPSPKEMIGFVEEIKELNIKYILVEPTDEIKISQVLADQAGASIEELYAMASVSNADIAAGKDYFTLMEANLEVLLKALSE